MSVWCIYGVAAMFSMTFFEAMHLKWKELDAVFCFVFVWMN